MQDVASNEAYQWTVCTGTQRGNVFIASISLAPLTVWDAELLVNTALHRNNPPTQHSDVFLKGAPLLWKENNTFFHLHKQQSSHFKYIVSVCVCEHQVIFKGKIKTACCF